MIPVKTCQRTGKKSQLELLVDHTNHEFQFTQQKKLVREKFFREISFKPKWFDNYKWLEYSVAKNAAFCFACRCFTLNDNSLPGLVENAFTTTGFSFRHKYNEMFRYHEKSKCHV